VRGGSGIGRTVRCILSWSLIGRFPSLSNLRYLLDLEEVLEELVSTALKLVRPRDRYNCHYLQRAIAFPFVLSVNDVDCCTEVELEPRFRRNLQVFFSAGRDRCS
jgi:hypothetical protein